MEGIVRLIRRVIFTRLLSSLSEVCFLRFAGHSICRLAKAVYFGMFHAVSFFNNAGFDLFGQFGVPYISITQYVSDPLVNIVTMLLIVTGGIGFIVMSDLMEYRNNKRLSLHSKVVLAMTGTLIAVGTIVIFYSNFPTL